jgi:hypothetical protein
MELKDKTIKEFQEIYKKEYKKDISWEDAREGAYSLMHLAKLIYDQGLIEHERNLRLEKEPKGFHIEGEGYTCFICGDSISNEETWYDRWGIKCLTCQKAINKKIVPASMAKNKDSWYSPYDLKSRFNIDKYSMKRAIKNGVLKPRIVPSKSGGPHAYLFLIKDNKDTLPPKKLTESQLVSEIKEDGKEWFHSEPWYKFVDPFDHLKGYKIMDYLKFTNKK